MAVTWINSIGFESNGTSSHTSEWGPVSNAAIVTSNARPRTGAYHLRIPSSAGFHSARYTDHLVSLGRCLRIGMYWYTDMIGNCLNNVGLFEVLGGTSIGMVRCVDGTQNMYSTWGALTWAAAMAATWRYFQFDLKVDPVNGWFRMWVDGVLQFSFDGNTGNQDIALLRLGHTYPANGWYGGAGLFDIDDITLHDTTGEAAPAQSPSYRYNWVDLSGAGALAQYTPNPNPANYDNVREVPHDSDTTYNYAGAAALTDTFLHAAHTTPALHRITSIIPTMYARKTDAGVDSRLRGVVRSNGTNLVTPDVALSTSHAFTQPGRFLVDDLGAQWADASFNAAEVGYQSEGSF